MSNPHGCRQCGHRLDAYPPDDIYTIAMMERCTVCSSKKRYKEIIFKCDNCFVENKMYFHSIEPHTTREILNARRNPQLSFFISTK